MLNNVVRYKHVVLSTDRPLQTNPRQVFKNFQGNTNGKNYAEMEESIALMWNEDTAMSLLHKYGLKKEERSESIKSRMGGRSRFLDHFLTDTIEDRTPMIGSENKVYSTADIGFFEAVLLAYTHHWNLRTSPDDWWFCVIKIISQHIELFYNKPSVRNLFVDFEGKKNLKVFVGTEEGWPVFEDMDFSSFFNNISLEIANNVKVPEYVDAVTANFTTTTSVKKIVSQITLMSSLQGYFNFYLIGSCGIPAIEMMGIEEDWKKLKVLKTLLEPVTNDLRLKESWWSLVQKIFEKLLETYCGQPDVDLVE